VAVRAFRTPVQLLFDFVNFILDLGGLILGRVGVVGRAGARGATRDLSLD
jgi:hypothetical protein